MNPVGLISMQYARPFTAGHFPLFAEMRRLGYDFVEPAQALSATGRPLPQAVKRAV